jgi:1,2-phenylacetyl-CoA epoxidase catalytic subunit
VSATGAAAGIESAAALDEPTRLALRDLLLTLADTKRLLGIRYSDCMLGSPSLETGIAAASMAQDEWGHSRLTYALLGDFGEDPARLEHERTPEEYHSMELLDRPFGSWTTMIAAALVIDGALTVQYEALAGSRYLAVRNRVQKLLDEEVLHRQYAAGWVHHLAKSSLAGSLSSDLVSMLPGALRWFGPEKADESSRLLGAGITSSGAAEQRAALLELVGPALHRAGLERTAGLVADASAWRHEGELSWDAWDPRRRRSGGGGPDEATVARVRGDHNRAMLLE